MGIAVLIASAIILLLTMAANALFTWFAGVYDQLFWNSFAIELGFKSTLNFNIGGVYNAIYLFAIAILTLFFAKKMIETYMAWANRRSGS